MVDPVLEMQDARCKMQDARSKVCKVQDARSRRKVLLSFLPFSWRNKYELTCLQQSILPACYRRPCWSTKGISHNPQAAPMFRTRRLLSSLTHGKGARLGNPAKPVQDMPPSGGYPTVSWGEGGQSDSVFQLRKKNYQFFFANTVWIDSLVHLFH